MCIQIFGKLIAEAGWNTGRNLLRDQNTGKIHDKSCFWAEKAIETVKYFKYFKLYEFWLGNFASCWVPCVHRRRKVLWRNESNADRQLRKKFFFGTFREEWMLYWFFSLFARHDSLRLCCAPSSGKPNGALKCGDFCFSSPFAAQTRAAFS